MPGVMITEKKYGPIHNAFSAGFDKGFQSGFIFGVDLTCVIYSILTYLLQS